MRPGKDIANEFVILAKMNRIMGHLYDGNWSKQEQGKRIMFYLSDRYPDLFEKAVKHLRAIGKQWAA